MVYYQLWKDCPHKQWLKAFSDQPLEGLYQLTESLLHLQFLCSTQWGTLLRDNSDQLLVHGLCALGRILTSVMEASNEPILRTCGFLLMKKFRKIWSFGKVDLVLMWHNIVRGMQADAEKEILLQRLDVLLQLESRNRNARGYFLTQIFEKNVQGRKFKVGSLPWYPVKFDDFSGFRKTSWKRYCWKFKE